MARISGEPVSTRVRARVGRVAHVDVWSETHVSSRSYGGGGSLYEGTGYVSAPSVSVTSRVEERQRIFVVFDDGTERTVGVAGLPARADHRLLVVENLEDDRLVVVRNLNTGLEWRSGRYPLARPGLPFLSIIVGGVLGVGAGFVTALAVVLGTHRMTANGDLRLLGVILAAPFIAFLAVFVPVVIGGSRKKGRIADRRNVDIRAFWAEVDERAAAAVLAHSS